MLFNFCQKLTIIIIPAFYSVTGEKTLMLKLKHLRFLIFRAANIIYEGDPHPLGTQYSGGFRPYAVRKGQVGKNPGTFVFRTQTSKCTLKRLQCSTSNTTQLKKGRMP